MTINELLQPYGMTATSSKKMEGYDSINYKVVTENNEKYVLKYYRSIIDWEIVEAENHLLNYLRDLDFEISQVIQNLNEQTLSKYEDGSFSRLLTFVEGNFLSEVNHTDELMFSFGQKTALLTKSLAHFSHPVYEKRRQAWDLKYASDNKYLTQYVENVSDRKLVEYYFDQWEQFTLPDLNNLHFQIIHSDLNDWNVLTKNGLVSGCIDFGDTAYSPRICEVAIALTYLMFEKNEPIQTTARFIEGYCSILQLTRKEIELLAMLIPMRLIISLCNSAHRKFLAQNTNEDLSYILISEKSSWTLLRKWITLNPTYIHNTFIKAAGLNILNKEQEKITIAKNRNQYFSKALSLSYQNPIFFEKAAFQYMYDRDGNTYLDAYNNIPLIGHSHPRVSEAVSRQIRNLNTNTRYHYKILGDYAAKLLAKFPAPLNKVFIVNSGSEASDLATRIAKTVTGRRDILAIEQGYHGNTMNGIHISDYKFSGKGGSGKPPQTHTLPLPKIYNGDFDTAQAYIDNAIHKIEQLIAQKIHPAAFIAECISGCGGQVPLADGYLKALFPILKKHGILTIVDEVQTGFGRTGSAFWAFEMHDVIPDIVVLGKPMGNGFPIAAVVTTSDIADAFANGMEFFSSFGGNPVSCHAANAVLYVVEEEQLQAHALKVGNYYKKQLRSLQKNYPVIGNVRGEGLFLGIEFIHPTTNQPNMALAKKIKNAMKERFILLSTDGKYNNVIKTKPPLCFDQSNVDRVCEELDNILKMER